MCANSKGRVVQRALRSFSSATGPEEGFSQENLLASGTGMGKGVWFFNSNKDRWKRFLTKTPNYKVCTHCSQTTCPYNYITVSLLHKPIFFFYSLLHSHTIVIDHLLHLYTITFSTDSFLSSFTEFFKNGCITPTNSLPLCIMVASIILQFIAL